MTDLDTEALLKGDERIIAEAKRRFKQCQDWESDSRKLFLDDLKFANADCDNGYQWPSDITNNRINEDRPCLTINKTRQHNLQITNDARQNKPSVKIAPVGNGATYESAQVFEGIVRHIEYISNASVAYDTASKFQVEAGIGYWRVVTDYTDTDSFDQEIFIRRIKDPLTVYIDPNIDEKDGSDARFAFIFDDMTKEDFNLAYPKDKDNASDLILGNIESWVGEDHVRVAEYYRRTQVPDKLLSFTSNNQPQMMRASDIPKKIASMVIDDPQTKIRDIMSDKVEWFLIAGDKIVDRQEWLGKYIPIVRVLGEETIIEGKLDRKGHTRALKDPQRMYNYFSSAAVEFVALQGKSPFTAAAQAIEGYENYWRTANTENYSVLPYNHRDDEGAEIPAPQRAQPPTPASGYLQAMQTAQQEMMMVSGQYEAQFGQPSNERSGKAINERQRQGDNATYHYIDNLATAIRFTGKILIDLIPKIYDTPRIIRILAEDGAESHVMLDPAAQMAYLQKQKQTGEDVKAIFNPNVGKYDVEADIGPAYATKRQEAFNALSQILAQAPELVNIAGDILFKAADFPMADEVAERLERMVPAQAKSDGPPPELLQAHAQMQQLQGQLQHMQALLTTMTQQLAEEKLDGKMKEQQLRGKDQMRDIEVYEAITKRMETLFKNAIITPKDNAMMLHDLMTEEHASDLRQVEAAGVQGLDQDSSNG